MLDWNNNGEPPGTSSGEPLDKSHSKPTSENPKVDIHVFNPYVNEILDENDYSSKNEEAGILSKRNEEENKNDDIHVANIKKKDY